MHSPADHLTTRACVSLFRPHTNSLLCEVHNIEPIALHTRVPSSICEIYCVVYKNAGQVLVQGFLVSVHLPCQEGV